jgi:CBS domain containing-hemolysin-like protein
MTPIDKVFMLPLTGKFDEATMRLVVDEGHSRVPVYRETRENIIGRWVGGCMQASECTTLACAAW